MTWRRQRLWRDPELALATLVGIVATVVTGSGAALVLLLWLHVAAIPAR